MINPTQNMIRKDIMILYAREVASEKKPIGKKSARKQLKNQELRDRILMYQLDYEGNKGCRIPTLREKDLAVRERLLSAA